jgi:hypothetical protein
VARSRLHFAASTGLLAAPGVFISRREAGYLCIIIINRAMLAAVRIPMRIRRNFKTPCGVLGSAASPGSVGLAGAQMVRNGLLETPFAAGHLRRIGPSPCPALTPILALCFSKKSEPFRPDTQRPPVCRSALKFPLRPMFPIPAADYHPSNGGTPGRVFFWEDRNGRGQL